ncbi:MAG: class I SAM-dependent methyltransferase [Bacteroidia bacterium]|nr:class I SAM-dependent methyltransferase [Bacteroidia bacterium]
MDIYENYINIGLGAGTQSVSKIRQFEKNYKRFFPADKEVGILDIGPGKGEMLSCLSGLGHTNLQAVDISASVIHFIKELGFNGYLANDLPSFLKGQKYTLITMCDVVDHIPKHQVVEIMSAVRKALTEDGLLIVQVPNMQSITANIFLYDDFTHESGYTERSMTQLLKLAGFSSVECYGFDFLDNSLKSKIQSLMQKCLWFFVKSARKINGTMPHRLLHPVFFAVVRK